MKLLWRRKELLVKALDRNGVKLLKERVEEGGRRPLVCRFWPCAAQVVRCPRSRAFLPVLVSSERGNAAEPSPREEKSVKTHIPYGGVQMRKTETVHKKNSKTGGREKERRGTRMD